MRIYKYQTIDNFFWKNFRKNELWFNSPRNFDDDFDSKLTLITDYTEPEIESFFRNSYFSNFNTQDGFESFIEKNLRCLNNDPKFRDSFFKDLMEDHVDKRIGITCLSKGYKNRVLWGNYADKGHGVCFVFDTSKDEEFFKSSYDVSYVNELPKIKLNESMDSMSKELEKYFTTKHIHWKEQKEVRIFRDKKGGYNYNPSSLTEIIFGTKTSKKNIQKIISIGLQKNSELEFYNILTINGKYGREKI